MSKKTALKIDNDSVTTVEVMASEIQKISDAMKAMLNGGLKKRTIMVLIKDQLNGIGLREIEAVLDAAANLADWSLNYDDIMGVRKEKPAS